MKILCLSLILVLTGACAVSKDLKTLEDFEAEQTWQRDTSCDPYPNGIACPECGEELFDSDPCLLLTSSPPKKNIHCPACKWSGYRTA